MEAIPCARYARYMAPFAGNCKEGRRDACKNVATLRNSATGLALGSSLA
jgi:hypothetical protein